MTVNRITEGIKNRLPCGKTAVALKNSALLYKENPSNRFYKKQFWLNLRAFFLLGRVYAPLNYEERKNTPVPARLYHITARRNIESIRKQGLLNKKTEMVFLTDSEEYVEGLSKHIEDPCVLVIDTEKMIADGCVFFEKVPQTPPRFWITESVLPQYIYF